MKTIHWYNHVSSNIYYGTLFGLIGLGITTGILYGFSTTILFPIYITIEPALPYSLIIFPIFGILLRKKFVLKDSFLMLAFTYTTWEMINYSIIDTLQFTGISPIVHNHTPNITIFSIWIILIIISYILVRPRHNFNHIFSILLFIQYSQHPFGYYQYNTEIGAVLDNLFGELSYVFFIWWSFNDRNK